jgi:1,4-alpha-glucan branching enzyme
MISKKFVKTRNECEVTFDCPASGAQTAELVCESNDWQPMSMKRLKNGRFRAKVRLPVDRSFQFRYLLDGCAWTNDEAADAYWPNEYGSDNGVVRTDGVS